MPPRDVNPVAEFLAKPSLGFLASLGTATVSMLEQLNVLIRIATGLVGLGIAVTTLILQIRKLRRG